MPSRFQHVKEILDTSVGGANIGAHGAFWRPLSLSQFMAKRVFGLLLVSPGDGSGSNLVLALRGQSPFGADTGTPGAIYRRMPAGRAPVAEADVAFIEAWITDGCPDDEMPAPQESAVALAAGQPSPEQLQRHLNYWREFDNWALFHATPPVEDAVGVFFSAAPVWFAWAAGRATEGEWEEALAAPGILSSVTLLSGKQAETVHDFYGDPPDPVLVMDSWSLFGADRLPPDPLRPDRPQHTMDGPHMWWFWAAFTDAALRLGTDTGFWRTHQRAILVGLLFDGLFRGRYSVLGFTADEAGGEAARVHCETLPDTRFGMEFRRRLVDSGLSL